jgi:glycosyltransferase involved in cell wall biosynthesis
MTDPLVSAIIPTYNRHPLLLEALTSIKEQSYPTIECIVVDDGSTDATPEISDFQDVRYIRIEHTGLPGQVRNRGAQEASGSILAFLDSDDLWMPDKIEKQVRFLSDHPEIPICHTREIWKRGERIISQAGQRHKRSGNIFKDCLKKCIVGPSTTVLTKSLFTDIGMFNPTLEIAEDYELWLRISARYQFGYIDEPLVIKRGGHTDQLSAKYGQIEIFRIKALSENIDQKVFNPAQLDLARMELERKCRIYAGGCIKRGKPSEAARYLALAEHHSNQ